MDSNNSNITTSSTADTDLFFPTSTSQQHFFDPLLGALPATFLDLPSTNSSWHPQEQTIHPDPTRAGRAAETKAAAAPGPTSRPSKKRSRASRRAPTTVLTTDTSNFRAMVQEFTGIPAPPFGNLQYFPRSMAMLINPPPPPPPPPSSFLIKPFTNKYFQPSASASASDPINFQSILQSRDQLLINSPQPAAPVTAPSSGELSLPGVIIEQQQQMDPTSGSCKLMNFPGHPGSMQAPPSAAAVVAEFRTKKGSEGGRGDGLLESWMCSSD